MEEPAPSATRRRFLAAVGAGATGAVAGCTDRLWSRAEEPPLEQVSFTITTPPADDDPSAVRIASQFAENLRQGGIDAYHEPVSETDLYREVLINRDFDAFVARHPGYDDPDALRELLHSGFVAEQGWQNPFGFSDGIVDDYLETQTREQGYQRRSTLGNLYEYLLETAPFRAIAFPAHVSAARPELDVSTPPHRHSDYLALAGRSTDRTALRVGIVDRTVTDRLNPVTVDHGETAIIIGLLYDPLVRYVDGEYVDWLTDTVEWTDDGDGDGDAGAGAGVRATVTLHEGLEWHDGRSLTADDVAFTIDFLEDTSLGEFEGGVPAPRYRGHTTLIDDVTVLDERRVRFAFDGPSAEVARRALTVPILPEHVWTDAARPVGDGRHLTEAFVWDNPDPVGSGPFALADGDESDRLRLEPFDAHVLWSPGATAGRERAIGLPADPTPAPIDFQLFPNVGATIDSLVEGTLDLIGSTITPDAAHRVASADEASAMHTQTQSFYFVGYNVDHSQLGNQRFREVASRLIDREHVVEAYLDGYASPAASHSSLAGIAPQDWEFQRRSGVPSFPGSDGEVDPETVRSLFRDIGYRYDDGVLLG